MKNIFRLFIFLSFLQFTQIAKAQMSADTLYLDEILITGHQTKAISKSIINAKIIEIQNPHDGGEIFKNQAGFSILKKGNYGMEPVLRGFKFERLNIQFDGGVHSTNACPNRMDPAISQISIEDIEKVEVINGPYSVRFGPAFGGIINIISKSPKYVPGKNFSNSVDVGYQSNGNNYYSDIFTRLVSKKFDFSIDAGYKNYGNYKSGSGQEIASSFKRTGYATKLGFIPKENQRIQINWQQSFARDILYAGLPMDADADNSSILSADYGISNLTEALFSLKVKLYGAMVTHLMTNSRRPNYKMTHASAPVSANNYGGRVELGISTSARNILFAGFDYQYIQKDGSRTREVFINGCTGQILPTPMTFHDLIWQNTSRADMGFFMENKVQVNSGLFWLAGARLDWISYSIRNPATDFSALYNGSILPNSRFTLHLTSSLEWNISPGIKLLWAAARAERAPDQLELFINHFSVGLDAYEYVGNPQLKSEVNYQTDLKIEKHWKGASVYADGFVSYLHNFISAEVNPNIPRKFMPCKDPKFTKQFSNIDQALMTGFETGLNVSFLTYFVYEFGASYTYAQNLSWDEPLPEIPPFTINNAISFKMKNFDTRLNARMAAAQNRVSSRFKESSTPGFSVYDIYVTYSPWKLLEIHASMINIFNRNYVEHLSRAYKNMDVASKYFEPGRSFNIGLKWNF